MACVDVSAVEAIDAAAADKETRGQLAALDAASTSRALLPSPPTHVAVSCDGLTLSVGVVVNDLPHIYFYDVRAFAAAGTQFNRNIFGLSFGLKNGLRFRFDSAKCLNYTFLNVFLVSEISSQNSIGFSSQNSSLKWFY